MTRRYLGDFNTWVYYYFLARRTYKATPNAAAKWSDQVCFWWQWCQPDHTCPMPGIQPYLKAYGVVKCKSN